MTQNMNEGHNTRSRGRRSVSTTKPTSGPVKTIKVDPALLPWLGWHERCLVIDSTTVIMCNGRKHRDYMRKVYAR